MVAHPNVPFETLVELVEQLPVEQQRLLLVRIQERIQHNGLTVDEKMKLLRSAQMHGRINQEPSLRREEWYDDDGR